MTEAQINRVNCPRCEREIDAAEEQCVYCGARLKRSFVRRMLERFCAPSTDEHKISQAVSKGKRPSMTSPEDLGVYLKHAIGDEEFALMIVGVLEKIGRDGSIFVKRGGEGNPYSVEYRTSEPPAHMSRGDVAKRIGELTKVLDSAKSPIEEERLQEELAQLVGTSATIWVNSSSQEDLDKASLLLEKTVQAIERVFG
ncbi:MAG: hypothetical protein JSW03_00880 [Candidatus Eiseniibacteriota bacterium]|nr:MAG: hypothetical protein JSW03_00880 [Candidatus Eisenbacteria bacterium]